MEFVVDNETIIRDLIMHLEVSQVLIERVHYFKLIGKKNRAVKQTVLETMKGARWWNSSRKNLG